MIAIVNKNKKNNKFLPMISLAENEEVLKKGAKKQLMEEIINNPECLKAYKEIEVYKIANVNEEMEIKETKRKILFTYEELLEEIVKNITEEKNKSELT
jgi:hypothetical protein